MAHQITLLDLPQVRELTHLSKTTIYRGVKEGTFVAPVKISPRRVAWRADQVQSWLESCQSVGTAVQSRVKEAA